MSAYTIRVLVVESDPQSLEMLTAALNASGNGFRVSAVRLLSVAVEVLRAEAFDVILLDLRLEDSVGLGTFATLYAESPDTPIVVFTQPADETVALKAVKSGAQDYLIKGEVHGTLLARALRYAVERRHAQEQINFQAKLLEAVGEAVIATDERGRVRYWNRFAERLYGWEAREAAGRPITELVLPEESRSKATEILRRVRAGALWSGELLLRRRDGSTFMAQVVDSPIVDAGGDLIGLVGTSTDVTERNRAAEALRESEQRLRIFGEQVPAILWSTDAELRVTSCTGAGLNAAGWKGPELTGRPLADLVERLGVEEAMIEANRAAVAGQPTSGGMRFGSRTCETHIEPLRGAHGTIVGAIGIALDVTERKLAQDALRASNEALRALITASPLAIIALDAASRVTMWNPSAERMFGWSEADVLGAPLPILCEPEDDPGRGRLEATLQGGSYTGAEIFCRRRDGSEIEVSLSAAPVRDGDGIINGIMALMEDLSPRRRLEERLLQSQKMEAIGRLAGGVAHDFNNLLTAITGHTQIVLEGLSDENPARADLFEIDRAAARAAALTQQLLAFSRKQILQPTVLDLNALISGIERMLRRVIGEDIELVTVLDPAAGRIKADPGQIEQVIMNLVVNARDAMPQGGSLVIETASAHLLADDPVLAGSAPGDFVLLTITDSGVGMSRDTLSHIFEPFFTTKAPGKGTGLGLPTVYGIISQSGGQVRAYSEPGRGTVFKLYLPRVRQSVTPAAAVPAEGGAVRGWETILLVEDEPAVRALARRVLQRYGYTVLEAAGGDEALALAENRDHDIHLLVTDVVMPGMSGREVAQQVTRVRPETAVLYTSGYTPDAIVEHQVIAAGAPFLPKPFTPVVLATKVREVLDGVAGGEE